MAIQSNISTGVTDLAAANTDTVLLAEAVGTRFAITAFSIFNTTASTQLTIDIYESTDGTSAAGKKVASYTLDGNTSVDIAELIGQGLIAGNNIVGRVTTGGATLGELNSKLTYTRYTAGS